MAEQSGRSALVTALTAPRRHAAALVAAAAAVGVAAAVGSRTAYFAAALVCFTVWMGWFVLTAVEWVREADF
jgi:hypothetical protein